MRKYVDTNTLGEEREGRYNGTLPRRASRYLRDVGTAGTGKSTAARTLLHFPESRLIVRGWMMVRIHRLCLSDTQNKQAWQVPAGKQAKQGLPVTAPGSSGANRLGAKCLGWMNRESTRSSKRPLVMCLRLMWRAHNFSIWRAASSRSPWVTKPSAKVFPHCLLSLSTYLSHSWYFVIPSFSSHLLLFASSSPVF